MGALTLVTRWSKHEDLDLYASVLEEWDDKVASSWEISSVKHVRVEEIMKDDNGLKYKYRENMIREHIVTAFKRCREFFEQIENILLI